MPSHPPSATDHAPRAKTQLDDPRRRAWLNRGAAAVTPVIASLASAPVHAVGTCVLPSGFVSAITFASRHPGASVCVVEGPNYWHSNVSVSGVWPAGTTTAVFTAIFSVSEGVESGIVNATTLDAVLGGGFSLLAKYCIAAYLNASAGTLGFPLTTAHAMAIYKSYHGGPFSSLLLPSWTEAQTLAWLQVLMA